MLQNRSKHWKRQQRSIRKKKKNVSQNSMLAEVAYDRKKKLALADVILRRVS